MRISPQKIIQSKEIVFFDTPLARLKLQIGRSGVNVINIPRAAFEQIYLHQKSTVFTTSF
jgi:hypothetical protein